MKFAFLFSVAFGIGFIFQNCQGMTAQNQESTPEILLSTHDENGKYKQGSFTYRVINDMVVIEGDILVGPKEEVEQSVPYHIPTRSSRVAQASQKVSRSSVLVNESYLWPNGDIPFFIKSTGTPEMNSLESRVIAAVAILNETLDTFKIDLNFRRLQSGEQSGDYVQIILDTTEANEYVCNSYVGRVGGPQEMNIGNRCSRVSMFHELFHAAGIGHEITRLDRNEYVEILWDNIIPEFKGEFRRNPFVNKDVGTYDLLSIMHYSHRAGSIDGINGVSEELGPRDVFKVLDPNFDLEDFFWVREPSAMDMKGLRYLYGSLPEYFSFLDGQISAGEVPDIATYMAARRIYQIEIGETASVTVAAENISHRETFVCQWVSPDGEILKTQSKTFPDDVSFGIFSCPYVPQGTHQNLVAKVFYQDNLIYSQEVRVVAQIQGQVARGFYRLLDSDTVYFVFGEMGYCRNPPGHLIRDVKMYTHFGSIPVMGSCHASADFSLTPVASPQSPAPTTPTPPLQPLYSSPDRGFYRLPGSDTVYFILDSSGYCENPPGDKIRDVEPKDDLGDRLLLGRCNPEMDYSFE